MADISSIKLPSGNTYNLKDSVARDKPDFDNFPTNPFSADINKKLYINKIDNAFYCADKRWTVVVTLYDSNNAVTGTNSGANLFDGNYESTVNVPLGGKAIILMTFDPTFPGYPYGHMFLSFYYNNFPSNVTGRVYCNYQAHGIGWHDITWSKTSYGSLDGNNWTGYNGLYQISQIEITVQGGDTTQTKISQLEMHLDRPHPGRNPFVSKYSAETLYYPLTAPSFIGDVTGNLNGSATLTGTPTAPTAAAGTNNTQIATTAFVNTALNAKATKTVLAATIPSSGWSGSNPCTNTVTVSGLLATDTPTMDLVASSTYATAQNEIADYAYIYKATCSANTLTVYATSAPTVDLSVQLVCVR